jgi:hypothetical protein
METVGACLHCILHALAAHPAQVEGAGAVLLFAFVSSLPAQRPKTLDDWYAYFRESLQSAIPVGRHSANPTPPANPAQPKS